MEYPSSDTHIDVFLPLRRGGAAPSRTLQLPRLLMMHGSAGIVIFQLVPFFRSKKAVLIFCVYIYTYYVCNTDR